MTAADPPDRDPATPAADRLVLAGIGLVQGVIYWLAYDFWPDDPSAHPPLVALMFLVSAAGLILHLAWTGSDHGRLARVSGAVGAVYGLIAYWVWWQIPAPGALYQGDDTRATTWIAGSAIALYILLPFIQIQQRTGRFTFPYPDLFRHSWNNIFIIQIGSLLASVYWVLIQLWVQLFKLIGITVFERVFREPAFVTITLATVAAYGLAIGRDNQRILNTLRRITLALFKALMPLLAVIAILFLGALPFTGLAPLWATRHAASILLSLTGLAILFFNAVYQDGESDMPRLFRRVVQALLVTLPLYAALALYAIGLRVGQYGVTPERFYGLLFGVVLALYAVAYAAGVFRRDATWMGGAATANVGIALLVVLLAVLVHTPALDPIGWSARSQYRRLATGSVEASAFDYGFLRFQLGRAGWDRLAELERLSEHPEAAVIRERIASAKAATGRWEVARPDALALENGDFKGPGSVGTLPEGLLDLLRRDLDGESAAECRRTHTCSAVPTDLDRDGTPEFVVVPSGPRYGSLYAYGRDSSGQWTRLGVLSSEERGAPMLDRAALLDTLGHSPPIAVEPQYRDLKIGPWVFRLR